MPNIKINDIKSFIFGIQVGRRIKVADATRGFPPKPPVPYGWSIITEGGVLVSAETGEQLITEEEPEV